MRKAILLGVIVIVLLLIGLTAKATDQKFSANKSYTNENLVMLDAGQFKPVMEYDNRQTGSINDSILRAQVEPSKNPTPTEKRRLTWQKKLDTYNPPQGKVDILVTGYSSTVDQCDADPFTTASGTRVHRGTMACPPEYPMGLKIKIKDAGVFTCEDRGGAIKGNHFDMWFASRGEALAWGKRTVEAEFIK